MADNFIFESSNIHSGDRLSFGRYPQSAKGGIESIEWRVLEIRDGKALIITEKLLDVVRYNEEFIEVTWETSMLRDWLNGYFFKKAFHRDEQSRVATVTNENPDNLLYRTSGGSVTEDKIFALSIDEAKRYFSSNQSRTASVTEYAYVHGELDKKGALRRYDDIKLGGFWWLRSPGNDNLSAANVFDNGAIDTFGTGATYDHVAVRPALWLKQ